MVSATLSITEHELSGARLAVPFTVLQQFGPKHHAIVVGVDDQKALWIAELSRKHGYRLVTLEQWISDNEKYSENTKLTPNPGPRANMEVARSAIDEVLAANETRPYDVVFNNCESFADRHQGTKTTLSPQVKKTLKMLGFVAAGGAYILSQKFGGGRRTS